MEHTEARNSHAAERYLLKEMNDAERDRFEDHFFGCVECAADVQTGSRFMTAGRAVVKEGGEVIRPAKWNWRWPLQAAAMAAAVYVGTLVPRVPAPALIAQFNEVQLGQTRTTTAPVITIESRQLNIFNLPPNDHLRWEAEIRDTGGKLVLEESGSIDETTLHLLPSSLPAGSYSLAIFGVDGGNRAEFSRYQLRVQ